MPARSFAETQELIEHARPEAKHYAYLYVFQSADNSRDEAVLLADFDAWMKANRGKPLRKWLADKLITLAAKLKQV